MTEVTDNLQNMKISWIWEIVFSGIPRFIPYDGSEKQKKKKRAQEKSTGPDPSLRPMTKIYLLEYALKYKVIKY